MGVPTFKTSGGSRRAEVSVGIGLANAIEACQSLVEAMDGRELSGAMADDFELMAREIREKIEEELQRDAAAAAVNATTTTAATAAEGKGHGEYIN